MLFFCFCFFFYLILLILFFFQVLLGFIVDIFDLFFSAMPGLSCQVQTKGATFSTIIYPSPFILSIYFCYFFPYSRPPPTTPGLLSQYSLSFLLVPSLCWDVWCYRQRCDRTRPAFISDFLFFLLSLFLIHFFFFAD